MAKVAIICVGVISGDTFNTNRLIRMRLARVNAPSVNTQEGQYAKELLEALMLAKFIHIDVVGGDNYGRAIAEVWVEKTHVNEVMRAAGYQEQETETSSRGTKIEEIIEDAQEAALSYTFVNVMN